MKVKHQHKQYHSYPPWIFIIRGVRKGHWWVSVTQSVETSVGFRLDC